MKYSNILAIGAHPDDIEYGCLGLLQSNAQSAKLHLYVASLGSLGDSTCGEQRVAETTSALAGLQNAELTIRRKKGILPTDFQELVKEIEDLIAEKKPDLILCHGPHDTHQEHKLLYDIVVSAARRSKLSMFLYSIVSNNAQFQPNFFYELTREEVEKKVRSLSYHKSQGDKYYMKPEYIRNFHRRPYTQLHEMNFAEAYEVERIML